MCLSTEFVIKRLAEHGGDVTFTCYEDLETAFSDKVSDDSIYIVYVESKKWYTCCFRIMILSQGWQLLHTPGWTNPKNQHEVDKIYHPYSEFESSQFLTVISI